MELDEAIKGRRSVRKYSEKSVAMDVLEQIIQAGMWAPSACNDQAYRFLIVNDKNQFDQMLTHGAASFLKNVSLAILVLYPNTSPNQEYKDYLQSGAAVIQNMLLKAYALGLGSCWVCNLPSQKDMRRIFRIPANYDAIALVTLGYPASQPKAIPRKKTVKDVTCWNAFCFSEERNPLLNKKKTFKRFLRAVYYRLPKFPFLRNLAEKSEKKFEN